MHRGKTHNPHQKKNDTKRYEHVSPPVRLRLNPLLLRPPFVSRLKLRSPRRQLRRTPSVGVFPCVTSCPYAALDEALARITASNEAAAPRNKVRKLDSYFYKVSRTMRMLHDGCQIRSLQRLPFSG